MGPRFGGWLLGLLILSAGCGPGENAASPGSAGLRTPDPQENHHGRPWFEEASDPLGLRFVHRSGARGELLFPEIMLGGVALLDADGDGDLDVYFVQGHGAPDELWRNDLWRNDLRRDDGQWDGQSFTRVDDALDASAAPAERYGMGAAVGDVDGDGDLDLFVSNVGRDLLLRNDSRGESIRFTDVTETAGVGGDGGWSSSAGFFDADGDGDLDLFVTRYVYWSPESDLDCASPSGGPDYCSPTSYSAPLPDLLYRNDGVDDSGQVVFLEVSAEAGLRQDFGNGLGLVFLDLDRDQDLDVFVANDQTPNQLWRNHGDGTFENVAQEMGTAVAPDGKARAGMGVAAADLDGDGDSEVLVVNLERQADELLHNEGAFFRDATATAGLGTLSRRYTRFGVGFADFDLDGRLDLYVANGRVTLPPGAATATAGRDPFAEPNLLFRGTADGRFEAVEPAGGTAEPLEATSRAAAFGDLDDDGDVDVVVVNRDGRAHVLRNLHSDTASRDTASRDTASRDAPSRGHWLLLDLVDESGRSTIGAEVTVRWRGTTFHRRVAPTSSYQSSNDRRLHFGLGRGEPPEGQRPAETEVEIRWPDGTVQNAGPLEPDRIHVVRRRD